MYLLESCTERFATVVLFQKILQSHLHNLITLVEKHLPLQPLPAYLPLLVTYIVFVSCPMQPTIRFVSRWKNWIKKSGTHCGNVTLKRWIREGDERGRRGEKREIDLSWNFIILFNFDHNSASNYDRVNNRKHKN